MLDTGNHPAFIGEQCFQRNAENGGCLFYLLRDQPIAITIINPRKGILLAMNVHPDHRGHGLGGVILQFIIPNFVRALDSKVEWFEKRGYRRIGLPKKGITLKTQLLAREALFHLAGNLRAAFHQNSKSPISQDNEREAIPAPRVEQIRTARKTTGSSTRSNNRKSPPRQ